VKQFFATIGLVILFALPVNAAIPLITDDTGTQGKGKFQLELFSEYSDDREARITSTTTDLSATLTYGLIDPVDIVLNIPYEFWSEDDSESEVKEDGIGDVAIETKWRFYEKEGLSFALKPGFTLPTGDEEKGLGTGKVTYYLYFITSKEMDPWAFHVNLAYIRNENENDERTDLWHASLASTVEVVKDLSVVGDIGAESNPDRSSDTPPAYVLGGIIYAMKENFDVGLGVKGGLTKPEPDISVRGGITWRF
jgi:hypothetical protein